MTRIAVIDPQPATRAGLSMLLRTEPGLVPVGAASGAHDGAELAERLRPDVVLLEPHLLDGDGLGLCRRLRAAAEGPRVVLYAGDMDPVLGEIARELECTPREVRDILRMAQQPVSLEKPIGEEEESELGDFVEDEAAESPFDVASTNLRRENVRKALDALPPREREVIEMRFGLTGARPYTLEEVGRAFNVTRERIRQIENHTLKKLESLPEAQRLRDTP